MSGIAQKQRLFRFSLNKNTYNKLQNNDLRKIKVLRKR